MHCTRIGNAIVCGTKPRKPYCSDRKCNRYGTFQCDFDLGNGQTCDKFICSDHATEIGPGKHLCPLHVKIAHLPEQKGLFA